MQAIKREQNWWYFHQEWNRWNDSLSCVSLPLMGEKLPYYCRVKKILAAVKNGPKLARPVVKSALEKLAGLCLKRPFSNNANGLRPLVGRDLRVTRHRLPTCHSVTRLYSACTNRKKQLTKENIMNPHTENTRQSSCYRLNLTFIFALCLSFLSPDSWRTLWLLVNKATSVSVQCVGNSYALALSSWLMPNCLTILTMTFSNLDEFARLFLTLTPLSAQIIASK